MNIEEKNKLLHDFTNSIVIINSLSKSASSFINKVTESDTPVSDSQMKLFKDSMLAIQNEAAKIERIFNRTIDI